MYEYKCKVKRVVDGDTMDVILDLGFDVHHAVRVRLAGIDTPESRTRDLDEKARGKLSKAFLKESIKGKKIVLKTKIKDAKGKFGRVIANMCFNLGHPRLSGFKNFIQAMQVSDWERAAIEMMDSKWSGQVGDRAVRLRDRVLRGDD